MKREASDHPKLWDLVDRLPEPYAHPFCAVGLLERVWHFTAKFTPRGNLGAKSDQSIARWLGWPLEPEILIEALVTSEWVDRHPEHRFLVHDWPEHADDAVHRQLARARLLFADGSPPKLTRLGEVERKRAKQFYDSQGDSATCARSAPDVRTVGAQSAPRPAPPRQSPAPPEPSKKKKETRVTARASKERVDSKQRIDATWNAGIEAALHYSPNAKRWTLVDKWRGALNQLAKAHQDEGQDVFAFVIHGYRYARRGWGKVDTYFHPKTLLAVANREEYLAAYHDAVRKGLSPPFREAGDDSRVSQTRRVAQSIEDQLDAARRQGTAPAGRNEPGGTARPPGNSAPAVRRVPPDG